MRHGLLLLFAALIRFVNGNKNDERDYIIWDSQLIQETVLRWNETYPDLIKADTSQNAFGLQRAGNGNQDCPFDEDVDGCNNYFFTIQDYITHPENSDSSNALPEVLLSGELHGNERVGPTAVMEAANLLLSAAFCEGKPHVHYGKDDEYYEDDEEELRLGHSLQTDSMSKQKELDKARNCRKELAQSGIDDVHRKWLAKLVSTRRIVVVPTANALGYFQNTRTENGIDPNRDFPYDLTNPRDCMQTIAGRTLNELWRSHLFQLSLTFHAGMEVVGYEWGAPTYSGSLSPDHIAQKLIADAYSHYGGSFRSVPAYQTGPMNDIVYPVRGGMEDWAYAGSWDPERVIQCEPTTFDEYPTYKTKYDNATLRTFNMLVEASDHKTPAGNTLGSSLDVLKHDTEGNGHISRNIRLALLAVDLVQPYVSIVGVNELPISDDIVSMQHGSDRLNHCQNIKTIMIPQLTSSTNHEDDVFIQWTVGGSLKIDNVALWYAKWDDIPNDNKLDCLNQPSPETIATLFHDKSSIFYQGDIIGSNNGTGYFNSDVGPNPTLSESHIHTLGPVFQGSVDLNKLSNVKSSDKIVVIASAIVDQDWINSPSSKERQGYMPHVPPQSHIVNARTNTDWYFESSSNNKKYIQGRLHWFSMPVTLVFGDYTKGSIGKQQQGRVINTIEVSNRFGDTTGGFVGGVTPNVDNNIVGGLNNTGTPQQNIIELLLSEGYALGIVIFIVLLVVVILCTRARKKRKTKKSDHHLISGEDSDDDYDSDDDDDYDDGYYDEEEEKELGLRRTRKTKITVNSTIPYKDKESPSSKQERGGNSEIELGRIR